MLRESRMQLGCGAMELILPMMYIITKFVSVAIPATNRPAAKVGNDVLNDVKILPINAIK